MIIVDTAPLVAAAIANDQDHDRCVEVFNRMHRERQTLVVPCFVVAETCYMIQRDGGNRTVAQFMRSLVGGIFQQIDLDDQDTMRAAHLIEQYEDLQLDAADAAVIALAEHHNLDTVITLDYRDFRVVRPSHVAAFTLLPPQAPGA
jgi:uncharacterized protein